MSSLPDELWRRIFEIGIGISGFSYKDLCCISISCRRFNRLSCEDPLWSHLLSTDFPLTHTSSPIASSSSSSSKTLYKLRFERDKKRRVAAHWRALLRKESQIYEHSRRIREIDTRIAQETTKMEETAAELYNLRRVRQASVALNVWQLEVVRGRQSQMLQQCVVPAESRIQALEMDLTLCSQQIKWLKNSYEYERCRLKTAKEKLVSMKYNPVQEHKPASGGKEHIFHAEGVGTPFPKRKKERI
ncbi:F-box protein SKIP24 [Gastrolobium bilobum]|uniref:F-box protein SKIP24 n=1 Tax=Gastrolobium bilobum TaxID=150636 RepID=UPI002AAFEDDA|nr:F-box protein SKIP24 [Gastrolobium bilobum]